MRSIGRHLLIELWACDHEALADEALIKRTLAEGTAACGGVLLRLTSYKFTPGGVTAAAVISKSHIAIHTWPEFGYAAVDIFTCGDDSNPYAVVPIFERALGAGTVETVEVPRGVGRSLAGAESGAARTYEPAR